MFSISQTSRGFFCLEWSSTEDGPKIVNLNHIKVQLDFNNKEVLTNIVNTFNPTIKSQSNSLSITISSNNVLISLLKINSDKNNNKIIKWYESKVMGKNFCDNYHNYYFPMDSDNNCLLVSLPKKYKENILNSSNRLGFNLIYLSVDIFSAAVLARQLYKKETKKEYLIWKVCNNNHHTLLYYNNDKIKLFIKLKSKLKELIPEIIIGSNKDAQTIKSLLSQILINSKSCNDFGNIFIYQTKENTDFIKKIINMNLNNIRLLDFNRLLIDDNKDKFKYISYVENGICFKGLDL